MKHMSTIFALAASAILLASCAGRNAASSVELHIPAEMRIPAELRAIMEANREIALPPTHPDFAQLAAGLLTPSAADDATRQAQIVNDMRQHAWQGEREISPYDLLAHEEIIWEIDFIFGVLRNAYAGYQYFGGDAVFLPLRDSMLEQLAGMSDPLPVYSYLEDLLLPSFRGVVADNHFSFSFPGGERLRMDAPAYALHMSGEFTLRKLAGDFVADIDGAAHRVLETALLSGESADGILPTLTADGEFAFAFARFDRAGNQPIEMSALFENIATGERHSRVVALHEIESPPQQYHTPLVKREDRGVTIMETRTFMPDVGIASDFFDAGFSMRDQPVFVLDLRGNRGGIGYFPVTWMYAYIGQRLIVGRNPALLWFRLNSPVVNEIMQSGHEGLPGINWDWPNPFPRDVIPDDNIAIVLMDNYVASAGEFFVSILRRLENALFVGTNTLGVYLTGGMAETVLPRSGLNMRIGTQLNLRPDFSLFEGVGFLPDLWVPPGESLERALAFIERYGLNSVRDAN